VSLHAQRYQCPRRATPQHHRRVCIKAKSQASQTPESHLQPHKTAAKTVLLATDNSTECDQAARWTAKALLHGTDSLHLLRVIPSPEYPFHLPPLSVAQLAKAETDQWARKQQLEELKLQQSQQMHQHFEPLLGEHAQLKIHTHVVPLASLDKGAVSATICEQADALPATVVVVASRSHGGLLEFIRGSVADYVVRNCQSPVAIIHEPIAGAAQPRKTSGRKSREGHGSLTNGNQIVLAVDASEESKVAVRWVADHLCTPEDTVHLLHVVPGQPKVMRADPTSGKIYPDAALESRVEQEVQAQAQAWSKNQAQPLLAILDAAGMKHEVYVLAQEREDRASAVAAAICKLADELGDNAVVVVSYHQRTPIMDFFVGNVSDSVAHRCTKPVIVLPGTKLHAAPAAQAVPRRAFAI